MCLCAAVRHAFGYKHGIYMAALRRKKAKKLDGEALLRDAWVTPHERDGNTVCRSSKPHNVWLDFFFFFPPSVKLIMWNRKASTENNGGEDVSIISALRENYFYV